MSSYEPTIDAPYRKYAELELRCHFLLLEGKEDDPETLAAEYQMTVLWEKLDEGQRRSLKGMGSDLNWVRRKCEPPPKGRKLPVEVTEVEQQELVAAIGSKDWNKTLHYLRLCAPMFPIVALASHRGKIYEAIGLRVHASVFYEQAADRDPANAELGLKALETIKQANAAKARQRAEEIISLPLTYPPALLAVAAAMILQRDETDGRTIDRQRFSALLIDAVSRLELEPANEIRTVAYQAAAAGFEVVGDPASALRCLNEGLKVSPNNDDLLILKGELLYGSQTEEAVKAFEKLTQKDTPNVWPFAFLAHFHLFKGKFGDSLEMNLEAWSRSDSDTLRAQLLEWQAICYAQLNYPPAVVRPIFEEAMALDPTNDSIAGNLAAFNDAVVKAHKFVWQITAVSPLKRKRTETSRELELVEVS